MDYIYRPFMHLTAGQRKLLCFLAYTGKTTDSRTRSLYAKGEDVTSAKLDKTLKSLVDYLRLQHYYLGDYALLSEHVTPLLLYLLKEMPQWIELFDTYYGKYQEPERRTLFRKMKLCLAGQADSLKTVIGSTPWEFLIPLVAESQFLPLMLEVSPYRIPDFVEQTAVWQLQNDVPDPKNMLGRIAELGHGSMITAKWGEVCSLVALYDFYKQGRYDEAAARHKNLYAYILRGTRALYAGDYKEAFTLMAAAIREKNKDSLPARKGFFNMVLNSYLMVMAYHLWKGDEGKKLGAVLNKEVFRSESSLRPVYWLANYLKYGITPAASSMTSLKNIPALQQYLALAIVRFFQHDMAWPKQLPKTPQTHILRHELSPCQALDEAEQQQLAREYGGEPLIRRLRFKARWEFLLEELTPGSGQKSDDTQQSSTRVSYLINSGYVEVREQSRLKSGQWGAGKRMSLDTFRKGTPFMDENDRKIASSISSYYSYDIDIKKALPHLIGSDRVYTGHYAPFEPVTISEEKPYLIIERTKKGFLLTSNIDKAKMSETVVYRKDNDTHYTVINMTDRQRSYYQKLLDIGTFPLEAEQQLRAFLPKVSDLVEVHSDLVEGGTTLQHRDGTGQLCLQLMPSAGTRNMYSVYCYARPLPEGKTVFEPGKGINPCVAETDEGRFQVTRDMKAERENLAVVSTFLEQSDFAEDQFDLNAPFADMQPAWLPPTGLLQLMQFAQEQPERFYMEWPEGGQLNLKTSQPSSWNIQLKSKNGWFEMEGEIPIDDDTVLTVEQLLMLVAESPRSGFIRLNENDYLSISDKLRKQLARIESLTVNNRGHLQVSELHASLLSSTLSGEVKIKHDKKIEQLQKTIKKSMAQQPDIPKQLKADLRYYQHDGYQWLCRMTGWGAGTCLADDMGLGKTVQTIAFLLHTQDEGPALVAAPASVVFNWRRELERFAPSLTVTVLNSQTDRQASIEQAKAGDVVLTTYGLFVTEAEQLQKKEWNTVCLDEAHVIKNRETKTSQAVMKLQAKHRIILTGTPVQNHLGELWNLFQFINPGLLGSYDQFSQKYIVPIELHDDKERSHQLRRIIQPFILRRTKQEVAEELPDKTEVNMPIELSDDEMAVYEVIRRRAKALLEEDGGGSPSVNTLAEITRLRQAACAPQLAEKSWTGSGSSKITTLLQLIEEIVDGGNSVLVFSQFTSFFALVRKALEAHPTLGGAKEGSYLYLDGGVPMRQRDQLVQDFQHGRKPIFLISLKAGGLGLNLTGANYVIHLDPWWNPAIEQQATDRAYRIGQRQNVTVYHLISQHTIEEKILRLHETKRNLADAMLSGTSQSHKLTAKDLLQMISE